MALIYCSLFPVFPDIDFFHCSRTNQTLRDPAGTFVSSLGRKEIR